MATYSREFTDTSAVSDQLSDVTAPPAPSSLAISNPTATTVDLSWSESGEGTAGYQVYRNGVIDTTTAATLDEWALTTLPVSVSWTSVAYGNGTFVATAQTTGSTGAYSVDGGNTWAAMTLPAVSAWRSVAYGNAAFVAVAYGGVAATSPDGVTWTAQALPSTAQWGSIAFGDGVFVATVTTSTSSVVARSADGVTWTLQSLPASLAGGTNVAFGNGTFLAVSTNSNMFRSVDAGLTWTQATLPMPAGTTGIAYGNGVWTAVAGSGIAATSQDGGITWTRRVFPVNQAPGKSLAYGNGLFVGIAGFSSTFRTYMSPDGATWTSRSIASAGNWSAAVYGGGVFVAVKFGSTVAAVAAPHNALTATITGLTQGTPYVFTATAFDKAGNESDPSAAGIYVNHADLGGATDAVTVVLTAPVETVNWSAVDPAGATDTATLRTAGTLVRTDAAGTTDAAGATWTRYLVAVDRAGATDSATTGAVGNVTVTVTEPAGTSDSVTVSAVRQQGATDTAGATDDHSSALGRSTAHLDTAGATDTATVALRSALAAVDRAGTSDTVQVLGAGRYTFGGTSGATDRVSLTAVSGRAFTDPAGATDTARPSRAMTLTFADATDTTDALDQSTGQTVRPTDPAGATDYVVTVLVSSRRFADWSTATDVMSRVVERVRGVTDRTGSSDTVLIDGRPPFPASFDTWGGADLGADTITVRNAPVVVTVPYGKRERNWTAATSTVVLRCSVQPYSGTEVVTDRQFTSTHLRLFAPPGTAITATSRVVFDGVSFEVDGEPDVWRDLDGRPSHIEASLKRLSG